MPLNVGSRLGHYDVTALIGEGGMGQVYQATDTKLKRQVALKILPDAFSADPERLARFQREAEVLASLNHPNIAQIHGLEEANGVRALVLELVEGPTLADRIKQGPIPLDEALPIAKQIAEALEAAHEAGVIHRDLKPANVKVKDDGTVKVLDFGLAKALDPSPTGDPSQSPTLTAAATQMGVIMGTAAYMSPEQARGKTVDKRADIWAFGVVLFEMLTGKKAFEGEDVSLTLASVMKSDLNVKTLPHDVPPTVRTVLRRCLEKDPSQRMRDIGDVRLAMEGAFESVDVRDADDRAAMSSVTRYRKRERIAVAIAIVSVVLAIAVARSRNPAGTGSAVARFSVPAEGLAVHVALSPDGRQLVLGAGFAGPGLWIRSLDSTEDRLLPGTEGALYPFWSPDGRSLGFFTYEELKIIDLSGGSPRTVCAINRGLGGTWNEDDLIVVGQSRGGLLQVPATGGEAIPVLSLNETRQDRSHRWPQFLPGGRRFLFQIVANPNDGGVYVGSLDSEERESLLLRTDGMAQYAESGHLLFGQGESLMAQALNADRLALAGDPTRVVDVVLPQARDFGYLPVSTSGAGWLVYLGGASAAPMQLRWLDRSGVDLGTVGDPGNYVEALLSPDGSRIAIYRDGDIWLLDPIRGTEQALTSDPGGGRYPRWSPDGRSIAYTSFQEGRNGLFRTAVGGTSPAQLLVASDFSLVASDWSADGHTLVYMGLNPASSWDLRQLSASGDGQPTNLVIGPSWEAFGVLSPDSRLLVGTHVKVKKSGRVSSRRFGLWVRRGF